MSGLWPSFHLYVEFDGNSFVFAMLSFASNSACCSTVLCLASGEYLILSGYFLTVTLTGTVSTVPSG